MRRAALLFENARMFDYIRENDPEVKETDSFAAYMDPVVANKKIYASIAGGVNFALEMQQSGVQVARAIYTAEEIAEQPSRRRACNLDALLRRGGLSKVWSA